jgi:hypothetical protein
VATKQVADLFHANAALLAERFGASVSGALGWAVFLDERDVFIDAEGGFIDAGFDLDGGAGSQTARFSRDRLESTSGRAREAIGAKTGMLLRLAAVARLSFLLTQSTVLL